MANILLATPISDHTVTSGYARSIFDLAKACSAKNINVDIRTIRSPEIDLARNRFATRFIKESYSHLLFIDEDMEFSPKDILACVEFDKPIVAVGYVRQGIDLKSFVEFMQKHDLKPTQENIATAMSCVSNFNLELNIDTSVKGKAEHQIQVVGGFLQVKRVGTGLMLIKKDVFLRMIEVKCVELWRNEQIDAEEIYKDGVYGFFSKLKVNDAILSEDFSFCHRWVNDCSGEIWSKIDTYVGHQGVFKFTGRYFDKLKHNMI